MSNKIGILIVTFLLAFLSGNARASERFYVIKKDTKVAFHFQHDPPKYGGYSSTSVFLILRKGTVWPELGTTKYHIKSGGGNAYFLLDKEECDLVSPNAWTAATKDYCEKTLAFAAEVDRKEYEQKQISQNQVSSPQPPASTPNAQPPQPASVTVEPLYTWDVTVHIGRKYWATKDKYELYSSLTTEVQAKTRSEAERIAASKSYTTNSALFGSRIEVAPAGTEGAKFRVYNCEATRQ